MPRFLLRLMRSGEIIRTFETDALWFHLARRDDYERAVAELDALNLEALPSRNAGLPSDHRLPMSSRPWVRRRLDRARGLRHP